MYRVTIVARTPQQSAAPTLVELGPVVDARKLAWSTELNAAGSATFACDPRTLPEDVKIRLRNLAAYPCEVWIDREGVRMFAGPIIGLGHGGSDLTVTAAGLFYYTRYMVIATDEVFTTVDQWNIARDLIEQWQDLDYGNYGLDVSAGSTSGKTRDRSYLGSVEEHVVAQRLVELADVIDGFDFWIDPDTRVLELADTRGTDKTATVILDARGITEPTAFLSVAAGDIASEAVGRSFDPDTDTVLFSGAENTTLRGIFRPLGNLGDVGWDHRPGHTRRSHRRVTHSPRRAAIQRRGVPDPGQRRRRDRLRRRRYRHLGL